MSSYYEDSEEDKYQQRKTSYYYLWDSLPNEPKSPNFKYPQQQFQVKNESRN